MTCHKWQNCAGLLIQKLLLPKKKPWIDEWSLASLSGERDTIISTVFETSPKNKRKLGKT